MLERSKNVDLHPDKIANATMGTIFEELIRKFNEALNENSGGHFTPRDVVHLMVDLTLAGDADRIRRQGIVCTVYDTCRGSGSMLMITKEHVIIGLLGGQPGTTKACLPCGFTASFTLQFPTSDGEPGPLAKALRAPAMNSAITL